MSALKKPLALIVDDEEDICELIVLSFETIDVDCVTAHSVSDAIVALQQHPIDICITDLRLPGEDGFVLLQYMQQHYPHVPVAMITAHGNVESAVEALKLGAFDFISKPFDLNVLRNVTLKAIEASRETQSAQPHDMLGNSRPMQMVRQLISKFARSQAPVFINGESGTGKELAARAIHNHSPRATGAFIAINCGAIPEHLLESEFFGYKKGSFTGADRDKIGLFQAAENGTLFLDEVADLPHAMQVKILRAIQERAIRAVGAMEEVAVNVRIISATHKDLEKMVAEGLFRQDLYYRLNVISLPLPPLRERLEDLPQLCVHILNKINKVNGLQVRISPEAILALKHYQFPGNVRELENILERAVALCDNNMIQPSDFNFTSQETNAMLLNDLPQDSLSTTPLEIQTQLDQIPAIKPSVIANTDQLQQYIDQIPLPDDIPDIERFLEGIEKRILQATLEKTHNNKTQAAEKLGISFRTIRYKLKKLEME